MASQQDMKRKLQEFEKAYAADENGILRVFDLDEMEKFRKQKATTTYVAGVTHYLTLGEYDAEAMEPSFLVFNDLLGMMSKHPSKLDADLLTIGLRGKSKLHRNIFCEVLCTRTTNEIREVDVAFSSTCDAFKRSIVEKMKTLPESVESKIFQVLASTISPKVPRTENMQQDFETDLRNLFLVYNTGVPISEEGVMTKFINRIIKKPTSAAEPTIKEVTKIVKDVYHEVFKVPLTKVNVDAIKEILMARRDPVGYYQSTLQEAFNNSQPFTRSRAAVVSRILVTRAFIDMAEIKMKFIENFGDTLTGLVGRNTSGCYREMLLKLLSRSSGD